MRPRSVRVAAVLAALSVVALSGCSGSSTANSSASPTGKITLKLWGWPKNLQKVVDTWNASHPDIQLKYTDAGGGDESAAKLITASRAGNAPDITLVENKSLPNLVTSGALADITQYTKSIQKDFTKATWAMTTFDGHVYGVPQDVGPMAITYRADIFKKYGLAAPKTWDEFAADARKIHAADKDVTIASFPATEFAQWAGIATQAGGTWWKLENGKWTVGIGDAATLKVADFFEKLYDEGVISTDALLTPAYDKALNNGTMLSWPSAVWAPSVLYSVAEGTAGKWEMARMPSWTAGDNTVTYEGGSSLSVTKDSKYPAQAAEFINWYNASTQGVKMLINDQALFPAASEGQKIAEDQAPPDLMPQQKDFYKLAADIAADTKPILWGPDANLATSKLQDNLNKAIENHTPWRDAFTATQQAVVADMKSNGFPVTNK